MASNNYVSKEIATVGLSRGLRVLFDGEPPEDDWITILAPSTNGILYNAYLLLR